MDSSPSNSSSKALARKSSDTQLMPPPPPPKRIKRPPKVLDEDVYTSALEHIIARDFFPGLLETDAQREYLDALEADDDEWIHEASNKVRQIMTPGPQTRSRRRMSATSFTHGLRSLESVQGTPVGWQGETPVSEAQTPRQTASSRGGHRTEDKVDLNLSLGAFQAKYTSEDNESFNKVLDKQNAKHAQKFPWLYNGNRLPSKRALAQQKVLTERGEPEPSSALALRSSEGSDARPATITTATNPSNPRNGLMFLPDDLEDRYPQHQSQADAAQQRSKAPPKAVNFSSTRVASNIQPASAEEDSDDDDTRSVGLSTIDAAIRRRATSSTAPSVSTAADSGSETPRVGGYAFVDAEPTATELRAMRAGHGDAAAGAAAERRRRDQALLHELIEANRLPGAAAVDGPNGFSIASQSSREALLHRMVERNAAKSRAASSTAAGSRLDQLRRDGAGKTPTPKFMSSPRTATSTSASAKTKPQGNLTPAAQRLFEQVGRTPRRDVGGGGWFDASRSHSSSASAAVKNEGARVGAFTPTPVRASAKRK